MISTSEFAETISTPKGINKNNLSQHTRSPAPSLVPRPRFPTAAGGLHHRYVESGGLVRVNDLINKYANDNVISVRLRIRGSPRRAVLMLRRLESQCTGEARESEEMKVKGGKREGG